MTKVILAGSVCIRCGKDRIVSKVWTERGLRGSPVTYTEAVCPDSDCQKLVDQDFALRRERKLKFAR